MDVGLFNFLNLAFIIIFLFVYIIGWFLFSGRMSPFDRSEEETFFWDLRTDPPTKTAFPSVEEEATLSLSVVVPAYNEESRLPAMLDECLQYLEERQMTERQFTYEVIVVDDGSGDRTTEVALSYARKYGAGKCRVLTLRRNRGKGGAVRRGMACARGRWLLFADADGATKFSDLEKLEGEMQAAAAEKPDAIVIGSRAHLEKQAIATRSMFRTFLMYGFHTLVWLLCVRSVRDTQCGFKLFTRDAARIVFSVLHVERWAFDVELLYIAERRHVTVREVAVNWTEIEGSKLIPFWSWLQMGLDLVLIWLKYQTGIWNVGDSKKLS